VSRLNQTGKFAGWNEGDVTGPFAPNDYRFLLIYHLIEKAG